MKLGIRQRKESLTKLISVLVFRVFLAYILLAKLVLYVAKSISES